MLLDYTIVKPAHLLFLSKTKHVKTEKPTYKKKQKQKETETNNRIHTDANYGVHILVSINRRYRRVRECIYVKQLVGQGCGQPKQRNFYHELKYKRLN